MYCIERGEELIIILGKARASAYPILGNGQRRQRLLEKRICMHHLTIGHEAG